MEGGTTQDEASGGAGGKPCVFPNTQQKAEGRERIKEGFGKFGVRFCTASQGKGPELAEAMGLGRSVVFLRFVHILSSEVSRENVHALGSVILFAQGPDSTRTSPQVPGGEQDDDNL